MKLVYFRKKIVLIIVTSRKWNIFGEQPNHPRIMAMRLGRLMLRAWASLNNLRKKANFVFQGLCQKVLKCWIFWIVTPPAKVSDYAIHEFNYDLVAAKYVASPSTK